MTSGRLARRSQSWTTKGSTTWLDPWHRRVFKQNRIQCLSIGFAVGSFSLGLSQVSRRTGLLSSIHWVLPCYSVCLLASIIHPMAGLSGTIPHSYPEFNDKIFLNGHCVDRENGHARENNGRADRTDLSRGR